MLRMFKIWVCFVPMLLFWIVAFPINAMLAFVPQAIYRYVVGRDLMQDADRVSEWVTDF